MNTIQKLLWNSRKGIYILGYFQPHEIESQIILYGQRLSGPTNLNVGGDVYNASTSVAISKLEEKEGNDYPLISLEISKYVISIFHLRIYFFNLSFVFITGIITESIIKSTIIVTSSSILSTSVVNEISLTGNIVHECICI